MQTTDSDFASEKGKDLLVRVATGRLSPWDALLGVNEQQLIAILSSSFEDETATPVGQGLGVLPGDVAGQLVIDRELGEFLLTEAARRGTSIDLVYAPPSGNLEDFHVLKESRGFVTNEKGETSFCAVQASCEGIPAVVGVDCRYEESIDRVTTLTYAFEDGSSLDVEQPARALRFSVGNREVEVPEPEYLSISGESGRIFRGKLEVAHPTEVLPAYRLLAHCYVEALERYGPREAESRLSDTDTFRVNREWLLGVLRSEEFSGFEVLIRAAAEAAETKVFSTAHTPEAMALARMFASEVSVDPDGRVKVEADEDRYGLGLLRDERMWNKRPRQ